MSDRVAAWSHRSPYAGHVSEHLTVAQPSGLVLLSAGTGGDQYQLNVGGAFGGGEGGGGDGGGGDGGGGEGGGDGGGESVTAVMVEQPQC